MNELMVLPELQVDEHNEIAEAYTPFIVALAENAKTAQAIKAKFDNASTDDEKLMLSSDAKNIRLATRSQRTTLDKVRKEMKAEAKRYTATLDGNAKKIREYSEAIESDMQSVENYALEIARLEVERLHNERTEQITILGGEDFLYRYPNGLGEYTPEQFDTVLEDIQGWIKLANFEKAEAKRIAEAEALKAKADAEKQIIRTARGKQLHAVGYYHDGDLAEISEGDFLKLLEKAQAEKVEADKKVEAEKLEAQRLAKIETDKQAEALRVANEKAKALEASNQKAIEQAKAEQKALQGSDAEKFKVLVDKAKELAQLAESIEGMESSKGKQALEWFVSNANTLSTNSYTAFNKLR